MVGLVVAPLAEADVLAILEYTLERWGESKYWEYRDLVEEAYADILDDPDCGHISVPSRPGVRGRPIGKPARRARHVIFYRVRSDAVVEVVRVLHDAMDFARHLRAGDHP